MKIDVLIEYDEKLSEVTFSSKAAQFTQTRPARIGLSRSINEKSNHELIEFIGESWEFLETIQEIFQREQNRNGRVLRIINPFESATFEPVPAFLAIQFYSTYLLTKIYPKTWTWRLCFPWFETYELTLKILGYKLFNPHKKEEFEKLLREKYKHISFISELINHA